MDLGRVIEGSCPTCNTPLARRGDCGWCPDCNVGHSVAGDTYTLHLEVDVTRLETSLRNFKPGKAILKLARDI